LNGIQEVRGSTPLGSTNSMGTYKLMRSLLGSACRSARLNHDAAK
jgi:hypothetical protein